MTTARIAAAAVGLTCAVLTTTTKHPYGLLPVVLVAAAWWLVDYILAAKGTP